MFLGIHETGPLTKGSLGNSELKKLNKLFTAGLLRAFKMLTYCDFPRESYWYAAFPKFI